MLEYWPFFVPSGVVVVTIAVIFWWLKRIQDRIEMHAERISRLEGREDS